MFWACLRFPLLPLQALGSAEDALGEPFAVVDGPQQRRRIVLANAAARAAGVRAEQPLAAAQTLCPGLAVLPRDPAAERQALESLAGWAYRFSADVAVAMPDALFVEIAGSLALFGGWPALQRRLRGELQTFGFAYSLGVAPTAAAAHVFATHADGAAIGSHARLAEALGHVPLAAGGFDAGIVAALYGMGFRTLHDLFVLPRAELARRIGAPALLHLDRMRGFAGEALPRWLPPPRFERRLEFGFGIETHEALSFPLRRLLREFALFLVARDGGVQRFALLLEHEHRAPTRIDVGLLAPQRDADALFELARMRFERVALAAPVHALILRADDLPALSPLHRDLFDAHRREQLDWPALAERLRARLGDAALRGLRQVADHRPGRAWRFVAVASAADESHPPRRRGEAKPRSGRNADAAAMPRTPAPIALPSRPFWLLQRPQAMSLPPARILAGPERIESGWWDEHDQQRDYYVIETRSGQRAWAFVRAGESQGWTLHGWFA